MNSTTNMCVCGRKRTKKDNNHNWKLHTSSCLKKRSNTPGVDVFFASKRQKTDQLGNICERSSGGALAVGERSSETSDAHTDRDHGIIIDGEGDGVRGSCDGDLGVGGSVGCSSSGVGETGDSCFGVGGCGGIISNSKGGNGVTGDPDSIGNNGCADQDADSVGDTGSVVITEMLEVVINEIRKDFESGIDGTLSNHTSEELSSKSKNECNISSSTVVTKPRVSFDEIQSTSGTAPVIEDRIRIHDKSSSSTTLQASEEPASSPLANTIPPVEKPNSSLSANVAIENLDPDPAMQQVSLSNDPAEIKKNKLDATLLDYYLKKGPAQVKATDLPNESFPKDGKRSFREAFYTKTLGGEKIYRDWLSYSVSENKAYCHTCLLFNKNKTDQSAKAWAINGFHAWHRANEAMILHETSDGHVEASLKAKMRILSTPVLPALEQSRKQSNAVNRDILRHLIDVTLYLSRHCLAFRGNRENFKGKLLGNFLDLTVLLAKYSPAMASYVARMQSKRARVNFLSWRNQNHLIDAIAAFIKEVVVKEIKKQKVFSVEMDTTFDYSRKEQLSFIVRYVDESTATVVERLIALKETPSTTGEHLFETFKSICDSLGLEWKLGLVGQSYDGALNMRSENAGLQGRVVAECETALYIWCTAHRLNLVIVDFTGCCIDAADMFGSLETLYDFVGSSKKRSKLYEDFQIEFYADQRIRRRRLKRVSTTRWFSHADALETVLFTLEAVIETLNPENYRDDRTGMSQARGLRNYFLSTRFLLTAFCYRKVFSIIRPVSLLLQGTDTDLLAAINNIERAKNEISQLRSDDNFEKVFEEAQKFMDDDHMANYYFEPLPIRRVRTKPKMPGEEASDEPIVDSLRKFKVETFFKSLDTIIQQLRERFNEKSNAVFKDLSLFSRKRLREVAGSPDALPCDAFKGFCSIYGRLVNRDDLFREYLQFSKVYFGCEAADSLPETLHGNADDEELQIFEDSDDPDQEQDEDNHGTDDFHEAEEEDVPKDAEGSKTEPSNAGSITKIFQVFLTCGLKTVFPTLHMALKIAVTLPVASAKPERSFSKLRLVKNKFRTTMTNNRLESLLIIACEQDVKFDYERIISIFAEKSELFAKSLL